MPEYLVIKKLFRGKLNEDNQLFNRYKKCATNNCKLYAAPKSEVI
ncbi:hypothetical protein [Latilactobacillus phage TMW 1.1365 P2]|nr:hypothetical protein [Latilactobacillus phage TMW 1.1365 P2]